MRTNTNGPVVAIDLDGTLGDYHAHFLRFAEAWYGRPMPDPRDINPGLPLHRFMQTSKSTYRQCKLAYRQGGLKRSMPCYPGAAELCRSVRKMGAELWICTTRPYLRLDNIDPDTRHFLRRNGIAAYDGLIYGPSKYRDLARIVGPERVAAVLDDLPELVESAERLGLQTILRDQPYNRHYEHVWRVADLEDAQRVVSMLIQKWKEDHGK
jgi:FMN phosphatase YigB (HAD superfamily)